MVGGVYGFKVHYKFADDGWVVGDRIFPADQDTIPAGTWRMMEVRMFDFSLVLLTPNEMVMSIQKVGDPTEAFFCIGDNVQGANCIFVDAGDTDLTAGEFWITGQNHDALRYRLPHGATGYTFPAIINGQEFTLTGDGKFYLNDGTTQITAGNFGVEVILKKVA